MHRFAVLMLFSGVAADPLRTNAPAIIPPLLPLQWGTVNPEGWVKDWAVAASRGAVSPEKSWFATGTGVAPTNAQHVALMNDGTEYPPGVGRANGWQHGQPPWAMDEQSAYWMDGITRLGLVLQEPRLLARAKRDIESVMENVHNFDNSAGAPEGWPRNVYSRAMLAYLDGTRDARVLPFFLKHWNSSYALAAECETNDVKDESGCRSLTQAEVMLEGYAYGGSEEMLHVAIDGLKKHQGVFMTAWNGPRCADYSQNSSCVTDSLELTHGVSWNEIAKLWALAAPWSAAEHGAWLNASDNAYSRMAELDLLPYGVNSGQEALSGVAPNASSETCDVSDFIHSNTWLLRNTGKGLYGDRLERAFHNAAAGALNRDYTKHVYYQNPNLQHIPVDFREYGDNISRRWELNEMHTPPCCTGNQARLLPNYIHHSWTATKDGGLAATMYGPNKVSAPIATSGGGSARVNISSVTDYPFAETIELRITTDATVTFPLHLRLPRWCKSPKIEVNGVAVTIQPNKLGFHVERRAWKSGDNVLVTLPMEPIIETSKTKNVGGLQSGCSPQHKDCFNFNRNNEVQGERGYATVSLGPLLFALPLEKPGSEWRYGLVADQTLKLNRQTAMPAHWDWPAVAPITLTAKARRISNFEDVWTLPMQPVLVDAEAEAETVTLVPYGCSKVFKVSMFPPVKHDDADEPSFRRAAVALEDSSPKKRALCSIFERANNIAGMVKTPGASSKLCHFLGNTTGEQACRKLCQAKTGCSSWTFHHADFTPSIWALGCYGRFDGVWMPTKPPKPVSSQWVDPSVACPLPPKPFHRGPAPYVAFSWDTVPVFYHSDNTSGPFAPEAARFIAEHFAMATIEKYMGSGPPTPADKAAGSKYGTKCCEEDRQIRALKAMKGVKRNLTTVLYLNSLLDFPNYRLHTLLLANNRSYWKSGRKTPSWWLRHDDGTPIIVGGDGNLNLTLYDLRVDGMRKAFVETCTNATRDPESGIDGCFVDRAIDGLPTSLPWDVAASLLAAHELAFTEMQHATAQNGHAPLICNHCYNASNLNSAQLESGCPELSSFQALRDNAANGKLVQFHVGASASSYAPCADQTQFIGNLATFLVGAGDHAYFGCGPWHTDIGWPALKRAVWHDEYTYKLGKPLGDAVRRGQLLTRKFASGTVASVDTSTKPWTGSIKWAHLADEAACKYQRRDNETYKANNVISCVNGEGQARCAARCDADDHCAGYGVYKPIRSGRCCTKRNSQGAAAWPLGVSFTKLVVPSGPCHVVPSPPTPPRPKPPPAPPVPPAPPSSPVDVRVIFRGNASFPYNKGAMIEALPDGRLVAACQAGIKEASPDQRILYSISGADGGWDADSWVSTAPEADSDGGALSQWEPTLFLTPNRTLWLFFSQGATTNAAGKLDLWAQTTDKSSDYSRWSPPRKLFDAATASPPRLTMWPISRVVVSPSDGAWLLPCDWGCGKNTGAFAMASRDRGATWSAEQAVAGIPSSGLCPEPAMAFANKTSLLAVIRSARIGFMQSWSNDGGRSWSPAVKSSVNGAAAKPALAAYGENQLVLAYNVETRERMALSASSDGGRSWNYFATLDNGTAGPPLPQSSTCYPTVLAQDEHLWTTWSTYDNGPRDGTAVGFANIKLARTALPAL